MNPAIMPGHMKKSFLDILILLIGSRNDDCCVGPGDAKLSCYARLGKLGGTHEFALGGSELVQIQQHLCSQWEIGIGHEGRVQLLTPAI